MNYIIKPVFILILILSLGCNDSYTPKPRGYFRITLPEKDYSRIETTLPYTFEKPDYAKLSPRKNTGNEPYWSNLMLQEFDAQVHLSYKKIEQNLYELLEDNREFAYKHSVKADAIQERLFQAPENNVYGILYEIEGNTASPVQFFATDSTKHFLRGSLYFNVVPNKDSIAPVIDFVKKDIVHLMETLRWKEL